MKICSMCGIEKPLSEYYPNNRSKGGFYVYCKECGKTRSRNPDNKLCQAPFCESLASGGKYCDTHRRWIKKGKDLKLPKQRQAVDEDYRGPFPEEGEKAIYILRYKADGSVFYVGSSKTPRKRLTAHRFQYGSDIQMATLRCVPLKDVVYWEAKTLVDYIDAGCPIINTESPVIRPDNRKLAI